MTLGLKMAERRKMTPEQRFWSFVDKSGDCWEWTGSLTRGYGCFFWGPTQKDRGRVHRYSWELHNGPIPDGLYICHRCDNRKCVNPDHLFLGTAQDNARDMVSKDRHGKSTHAKGKKYAAKLDWDKVREIRSLHAMGLNQRELAELFGITKHNVGFIVRNKTWVE